MGRGLADPETRVVSMAKNGNFSSRFYRKSRKKTGANYVLFLVILKFYDRKGACYMAGRSEAVKIGDTTEVTVSELSVILGLTSRRVRQLAEEGIIQSTGKNAYNLASSVQSYNKFLCNRLPNDEDMKLEKTKRMAETQLKASKATVAKLQAKELQGKMHRSEDVADLTADLIYTIRGALIAMPGRMAASLVDIHSASEVSEIIRKEVYTVMRELAAYKYDPEKYAERVRERMDWNGVDGSDDDE